MPWSTPCFSDCCNSNLPSCSKLNFVSDDLLNTRTASSNFSGASFPLTLKICPLAMHSAAADQEIPEPDPRAKRSTQQ